MGRDFAFLFMEGARSMGFAARFVTGYLHDPAADRACVNTLCHANDLCESACRLWVRFGLYRHRTGTSVPGGKADEISTKTDTGTHAA